MKENPEFFVVVIVCLWGREPIRQTGSVLANDKNVKKRHHQKMGYAMLPQESFSLSHERAGRKSAQQHKGHTPCIETLQVLRTTPPYGKRNVLGEFFKTSKPASRVRLGSLTVKTCELILCNERSAQTRRRLGYRRMRRTT